MNSNCKKLKSHKIQHRYVFCIVKVYFDPRH